MHLWLDENPVANDKSFLDGIKMVIEPKTLLIFDRGFYFFCGAYSRQEATDPVTYLAAQTDLGIVKRRRKNRERAQLDKGP